MEDFKFFLPKDYRITVVNRNEFGEVRTKVINNEPYFSLNEYQNTASFLKIVNR